MKFQTRQLEIDRIIAFTSCCQFQRAHLQRGCEARRRGQQAPRAVDASRERLETRAQGAHGGAVQVESMKLVCKAPGTMRLKRNYDMALQLSFQFLLALLRHGVVSERAQGGGRRGRGGVENIHSTHVEYSPAHPPPPPPPSLLLPPPRVCVCIHPVYTSIRHAPLSVRVLLLHKSPVKTDTDFECPHLPPHPQCVCMSIHPVDKSYSKFGYSGVLNDPHARRSSAEARPKNPRWGGAS